MRRYTLHHTDKFGEIVFGFEPDLGAFFVKCFRVCAEDAPPIHWHPRLTLPDLTHVLGDCGVMLPDLMRRVLVAEQTGGPLQLAVGDPVLFRNEAQRLRAGRVRGLGGGALDPKGCVLVDGAVFWQNAQQLEPDFLSVGVD